MWVERETKTRPVAGFDGDVVGAAVSLDVELLDLERLSLHRQRCGHDAGKNPRHGQKHLFCHLKPRCV